MVFNVSWEAKSPATASLALALGACFGTEENYECADLGEISGASPLSLEVSRVDGPFNYYYAVVTLPPQATQPHAHATMEQPFVLDGFVVWVEGA